MKIGHRLYLASVFVVCIFFYIAAAFASDHSKLPRSFGPLYLGMTENKFFKILKIKSYACGDGCVAAESIAAIDLREYPQYFPRSEYPEDGIDCMFYKNKLYKIVLPSPNISIDSYRKTYSEKYGSPAKEEHWPNGISWVIWDNGVTLHSVTYVSRQGNDYPYNLPIRTVMSVEYIDKAASNAVLRDEKQEEKRKKNRD
jgi:hypothetical protein